MQQGQMPQGVPSGQQQVVAGVQPIMPHNTLMQGQPALAVHPGVAQQTYVPDASQISQIAHYSMLQSLNAHGRYMRK